MNLPVILPEIKAQQWSCHGCTNCCRELVVHLTPRDRREIDRQDWGDKIGGPAYVKLGSQYVLNHAPNRACVFLDDAGKCRIHAAHGSEAKPLACQLYPFSLHRAATALRASLRFDCPSTGRNLGEKISSHGREVSRLARELDNTVPLMFAGRPTATQLTGDRALSPAEEDALLERLDEWIRDTNVPFARRLVGMASITETLAAAKLSEFDEDRFIELVTLLFDDLPAAVDDVLSSALPPPTARQLRLLRMTIFAHCEFVRFEQARQGFFASLRYRWGQLSRARRFASDDGTIPALWEGCRPVHHSDVSRPSTASLQRGADELLTRYIRARLQGRTAYGAGYYGVPWVDGLRALSLAICSVGWLSSYAAYQEERKVAEIDDFVRAVAVVDRNAGRSPELGARTAILRGRYLSANQGIIRLILSSFP
jgi:lysine-N-methylase